LSINHFITRWALE